MNLLGKSLILTIVLLISTPSTSEDDLYKILGVKKSTSAKEIKKAYKALAREWHPDKNSAPEANEKFMKINEAYETLSDPDKRSKYDNFGTTAGEMGQQHRGGGGGFDGFESFFSGGQFGGFNFHFGEGGGRRKESNLDRHRITIRSYETKVIPESRTRPYLLYAYADFCFQCMQVETIWERVRGDLESIGMGVGAVHVHMDQTVSRKLRISSIPAFVAIVKGKPIHYSGRHFSVQGIRDFVRGLFPTGQIQELSDKNYEQFLKGWKDNHVRMIFCDNTNVLSLRFLAAAFANRDRIVAGYIQTNRMGTESFRKKYAVKQSGETFLIFNEEIETPVAHINMKTISRSTMDQVIESNEYLIMPRLSSQNVFNSLCPTASSMRKKLVCVVLLSRNIEEHEDYLSSFRQYAQDHQDQDERVRYTYVWEDTQKGFVRDLTKGQGIVNETLGTLKVAVIWRRDNKKVNYDWLEDGWYSSGSDLMRSRRQLHRLVDWVLQSRDTLPHVMEMRLELTDEHIEALLSRMMNKLRDWIDLVWDKITHLDEVSIITSIATITFIIVIGFMVKTLVYIEEDRVGENFRTRDTKRSRPSDGRQRYSEPQQPVVSVHPLCSQNFEELIIRTEPGVRCIVLLVDEDSRHKLLQHFVTVLHPYSRSQAFNFAFLQLEQYLPWYRRLLEYTVEDNRDLTKINMKNCIGTVLVINGLRKYYCIYHAYAEKMRRLKNAGGGGADFMGFDDEDETEQPGNNGAEEKLFHSDLLSGFGIWMEKLLEGTLQRYRVDVWPNMAVMS